MSVKEIRETSDRENDIGEGTRARASIFYIGKVCSQQKIHGKKWKVSLDR